MDHRVVRGQVIHVNEDGWVVINRGSQDGVVEGQKFVVLGERNPRQIHDLYPQSAENSRAAQPAVLRVDTAYELLRVILVERACCVAISDRVPQDRTPLPFLGPQGELLLYTPPPPDWRYDALDLDETQEKTDEEDAEDEDEDDEAEAGDDAADEAEDAAIDPTTQQDRLWDGALPLNALQVGDEVVLAQPYLPGAGARATNGSESAGTQFPQAPAAEGAWATGSTASENEPASPGAAATMPEAYDWFKTS